jgi:hypothetical protein
VLQGVFIIALLTEHWLAGDFRIDAASAETVRAELVARVAQINENIKSTEG